MYVVMLVVCVVLLVGAGIGAPGLSTCPAKTDIESVRLRIVPAHTLRKVFTFGASLESCKNFAITRERPARSVRARPCDGRRG